MPFPPPKPHTPHPKRPRRRRGLLVSLAEKAAAFPAKGDSLHSARRRHKLRIPPPAAKRQAALTPLRLLSPPDPLRWAPAGAPCGKRFDARSAQSVFPTPQRKQTCRWHVCSVGRSGYAARREPCGCSFSFAACGRRTRRGQAASVRQHSCLRLRANSARLFYRYSSRLNQVTMLPPA